MVISIGNTGGQTISNSAKHEASWLIKIIHLSVRLNRFKETILTPIDNNEHAYTTSDTDTAPCGV